MKPTIIIGSAIITLLLMNACTTPDTPTGPDIEPIMLDATGSTPSGMNTVADGNNQFAVDLYQELVKEEAGNIFFSPWSMTSALVMTYEGTRGQTATEMEQVLYITRDESVRRPNFAALHNTLNPDEAPYQLHTANALWVQQDYPFLAEYTGTVTQYYGGKITNLDFVGDPENSRVTINTWVEEQTNDRIKDILSQGSITPLTRLVLTNAIYFKGDWQQQFDKKETRDEDFRVSSDEIKSVPMMRQTGKDAKFNYTETDDLQVLELSYKGNDLAMMIILPNDDDIAKAEKALTPENINAWQEAMRTQRVDIFIPKFTFDTKYNIGQTLAEMGMPTAFSDVADFSGMSTAEQLAITAIIHQAFVLVDEEGTEAAAATAIVVGATSMPPPTPIFRADHPFLFLIYQKETGTILFLGRVTDPTI